MIASYGLNKLWGTRPWGTFPSVYDVSNLFALLHQHLFLTRGLRVKDSNVMMKENTTANSFIYCHKHFATLRRLIKLNSLSMLWASQLCRQRKILSLQYKLLGELRNIPKTNKEVSNYLPQQQRAGSHSTGLLNPLRTINYWGLRTHSYCKILHVMTLQQCAEMRDVLMWKKQVEKPLPHQ